MIIDILCAFRKAYALKRSWFFVMVSLFIPGLLMNCVSLEAQSWEFVGKDTFSTRADADYQDIAFKPSNGTPYVVYAEADEMGEFLGNTVKKFNGNEWVTVGSETFTAKESDDPDLAFSSANNQPYMVYGNDEDLLAVRTFDGNQWQFVGPDKLDKHKILPPDIAISSGTPYVIYGERLGGINVKKYNGNRWVYVGKDNFFSTGNVYGYQVDLAIDPTDGTPYIAHLDRPSDLQTPHPTVKKFNGNKWVTVGAYNFTDSIGRAPDLAFNPNSGVPYIAYYDEANGDRVTVEKFEGNEWVTVGDAGFPNAETDFPSLSIRPSTGTPYVAYGNNAAGITNLTVQKFNGDQWEPVGNNPLTGEIDYFDLGIHPASENLYVAYSSVFKGGKTSVQTYETSTSTGSPIASSNSPAIRIYPNPAQNQLKLQTKTQTQTYTLHTLTGQKVQSGKLIGKGTHALDVSNLSPGVYLLQVQGEDIVRTKKVVVR